MRDSYDHYFAGWSLDPDESDPAKAEFAILVAAVGAHLTNDQAAAEDWRTFQLDGKKDCFFHFLRRARDAGALPSETAPLMDRLKSTYPRSLV